MSHWMMAAGALLIWGLMVVVYYRTVLRHQPDSQQLRPSWLPARKPPPKTGGDPHAERLAADLQAAIIISRQSVDGAAADLPATRLAVRRARLQADNASVAVGAAAILKPQYPAVAEQEGLLAENARLAAAASDRAAAVLAAREAEALARTDESAAPVDPERPA
jgi:hypothetical protein